MYEARDQYDIASASIQKLGKNKFRDEKKFKLNVVNKKKF